MIQALIIAVFAICALLFVFGDRRTRTLLALLSIFVAGFEVEIGIGLNLPSLLAILSGLLLATGNIEIAPRCWRLFAGRMLLFFLWAFAVWLVGYYNLQEMDNAHYGWTRGSTIKPIIQLARCLCFVPFAVVVADGLSRTEDWRWFLTRWAGIATFSALLCIGQVAAHKFTGKTVGIYNAHTGDFRTAQTRIAGVTLLRANGFAGEPKSQGMAMAISLCMLVAARERNSLQLSRTKHLTCISLVALAMLLTFSSGAMVMVPVLIGIMVLRRRGGRARQIAVALLLLILASVVCFPQYARGIWQARLRKVVDLGMDIRGTGWGMDKERPAMIYLIDNPALAVTGVGVGIGPYHFDKLIQDQRFRGKYVDPNGGVLWGLYSFGLIGTLLMFWGLWPEIGGSGIDEEARFQTTTLLRFTLLYFVVYTALWWLMIAIGISCSRAVQKRRHANPMIESDNQELERAA